MNTQQVRDAYPEPVPNPSVPTCDHRLRPDGPAVLVAFPASGALANTQGNILLKVHWRQRGWWEKFAHTMAVYDYRLRDPASGTANCRRIAGTRKASLHSYLSAIDLNPSRNSGTNSDQPAAFVAAIKNIRDTEGNPAFRNLPNDRMHWQINTALENEEEHMAGWTQPGDPVVDQADGAAALRYMGGFALEGVPQGVLQPLGHIADTLMLHDQRLRGGGALPDHTHTPGDVAR